MKLTIQDMIDLAETHQGKCLSTVYINNATNLTWQCKYGHQWEAIPTVIKFQKSWCPRCAKNFPLTIQDLQITAEQRNGKCLSTEYYGVNEPHEWQCKYGHHWNAPPSRVRHGSWCPYCAGRVKNTIENLKSLAIKRGGQCLSQSYTNTKIKLLWQCKKHHEWYARPDMIKSGQWCSKCQGLNKHSIDDMDKLASLKGGICVSRIYKNRFTKLIWECNKGHHWESIPQTILQGRWCPYCSKNSRLSIEKMHLLAKHNSGLCLSTKYTNTNTKLKWQCRQGHIWESRPGSIISGHWCPHCKELVMEPECRRIFELLFHTSFPKCRPNWLRNPLTNKPLELDGYSEKLKISFEYNGLQHYKPIPYFKSDTSHLVIRKYLDALKQKLCSEHNVTLIEIPAMARRSDIYKYIIKRLRDLQISGWDEDRLATGTVQRDLMSFE